MDLNKIVQDGLDTSYQLEDQYESLMLNAPLLLSVKEAILDILGANKQEYNNQKGNLDMLKLPENIKKIIFSTNIDEIIGALKTEDQKESFMKMFDQNPESRFLNNLGLTEQLSKKIFFQKSLESDRKKGLPENWRACYNLGITVVNHNEAIKYLLTALNNDNTPFNFKYKIGAAIGKLYFTQGNYDEAIYYFTLSLSLKTSQANVGMIYATMGICHFNLGNYNSAINHYRMSLNYELHGNKPGSLFGMGCCYYYLGDYDKVFYYYSQVLADPNFPEEKRGELISLLKLVEEMNGGFENDNE